MLSFIVNERVNVAQETATGKMFVIDNFPSFSGYPWDLQTGRPPLRIDGLSCHGQIPKQNCIFDDVGARDTGIWNSR